MMIGAVVGAVVIAGGSFYGGIAYGKSTTPARGSGQYAGGVGGAAGGMRRTANGGFVAGKVIASDSTGITVQTQDGSTKIILVAPSTQVMKSTAGSSSDLTNGISVVVTGTANADGSIAAQNIQIRPAGSTLMSGRGTQTQ